MLCDSCPISNVEHGTGETQHKSCGPGAVVDSIDFDCRKSQTILEFFAAGIARTLFLINIRVRARNGIATYVIENFMSLFCGLNRN